MTTQETQYPEGLSEEDYELLESLCPNDMVAPTPISEKHLVSTNGKVFSLAYGNLRMLKTPTSGNGYKYVDIAGKMHSIHRLMAMTFWNPQPGYNVVAHNDGNCGNNTLANIRWTNHAGNSADCVRHGHSAKGIKNNMAKLDDAKVREIRNLAANGMRIKQVAEIYNMHRMTISRIVRGIYWRHVA